VRRKQVRNDKSACALDESVTPAEKSLQQCAPKAARPLA
jgi:hypothetical protein